MTRDETGSPSSNSYGYGQQQTYNAGQPNSDGYQYGSAYGYEQQDSYNSGRQSQPEGNWSNEPNWGRIDSAQYPPQQTPGYGNAGPGGYAQSYYESNNQRPYEGGNTYPAQGNQYGSNEQPYGSAAPPPPMYGQDYIPPQHRPDAGGSYGPPSASAGDDAAAAAGLTEDEARERGLAGALAGGAAGAYGGHKVHHGFLGTVGGAIAGSMAENAWKKHEKEKKRKEEEAAAAALAAQQQQQLQYQQYQQFHHPAPAAMEGNFHASSRDVRLDGRCTLVAECADVHGHHHRAALDLNDCLTNSNGRLLWARGGNFAASCRDIRLADGGSVLEAAAGDGSGGWMHNRIWLDERITNNDGRLEMT